MPKITIKQRAQEAAQARHNLYQRVYDLHADNHPQKVIAATLGIPQTTVSDILRRGGFRARRPYTKGAKGCTSAPTAATAGRPAKTSSAT